MRLAVVAHPTRPAADAAAREVIDGAIARGLEVVVSGDAGDRYPEAAPWAGGADGSPDVVIAVGGDGTMLGAARLARPHRLPVLGVNTGTVGYLTEVDPNAVGEMLDRLIAGDYSVSERMALLAQLPDGAEVTALNDVVVEKAVSQHVVGIGVSIDGHRLGTHRADAVVVATPTGSTAYTFSAGGPVVDPGVEAIVITPVAAHSLFGRSIVVSAASTVVLEVLGERAAGVNADGMKVGDLAPSQSIAVTRAPEPDRIIRFTSDTFAQTVANTYGQRHAR